MPVEYVSTVTPTRDSARSRCWCGALRNPALAARLRESFAAAGEALAAIARAGSVTGSGLAPEALANMLLCVLPGYLLQLTVRGADAVKAVPDTVCALIPADRAERK
jgi:hypothetical protein